MPKQIINAHAHVFTGNFVPPFLAKTLVAWPFYYIIHTAAIVWLVKIFFKIKYDFKYSKSKLKRVYDAFKKNFHPIKKAIRKIRFWVLGNYIVRILIKLVIFWLSLVALIYFIDYLMLLFQIDEVANSYLVIARDWLKAKFLYLELSKFWKIIWIVCVLLLIKSSRRPILFVIKSIFPAVKKLFSVSFLDLLERYYLLGRYATTYSNQNEIASRALNQLPKDSGLVMLPMDMRFMKAGRTFPSKKQKAIAKKYVGKKVASNLEYLDNSIGIKIKDSFKYQMLEMYHFAIDKKKHTPKENYYPFLFVDPRRVKDEGKTFFDWQWKRNAQGNVINEMELKNCFVKTYMEDCKFSGFKIYPALGYHCFDEYLLPIWRYAAEQEIPIMTHCVMGRIYYRGTLKRQWHNHPVFKEDDEETQKNLPETKHYDFQRNFTHPLNYLCLVEPSLMEGALKAVKNETSSRAREAFHYDCSLPGKGDLDKLSKLKICLAHYGGEEEWTKYMEQDREVYSQRIMREPRVGIKFMKNAKNVFHGPK